MIRLLLEGEARQEGLGRRLAVLLGGRVLVFLEGDLGTGKTTLVRGILQGLGHTGAVKSPTYTLIEPYELAGRSVYHLDLYRLGDPEELDYLGLRDLLAEDALVLVEWPERGAGALPPPDLRVRIAYAGEGRRLELDAGTARGEAALAALAASPPGPTDSSARP
ncbi:tRNA (adenosine(37)-N6)-threonylcarbamoyltransferase complex ATPase subunit type 1 TsaE [Thiococcus pfennigii]|jgi:tRNA threonylcarbamoyladenosine biosynthesis protein TsaE|uniref:tRNA (adenosine(37)-N6)-threonylcarbamoyltransferase complex ATPase subunit type 1 TsaE n=1 Tax=Thiococcus pfennigii TaxID=1057 RepID=UPI001903EED9|nr:tRNA (adenosine(37)-N6)-threonylcarbamoyltransferase complex ATPase subunit type 1 TsaE [Thiococcus pfennigii]MBK1702354.1 tRNA (adenosine(37)-N6)-threonylcarbamoyltransferase complex ATPase subunit type 1 TsaE [Thiococcus pfennigii]MBK1732581.1 tRNA (adenosine(37)-N6)-threonylcarbamoyltransferase complex ATPase subunit type 1 TsaE [Thiococcus pfennigii]